MGVGFGAIQAGLFLYEAFKSGNFKRLVVAEVVPDVVESIRRSGGRYCANIAGQKGITHAEITGVEIYNPLDAEDRKKLVAAVAEASEICTALPSVKFFDSGNETGPAAVIAEACRTKVNDSQLPSAIIYAAENHNHAAEILESAVKNRIGMGETLDGRCQFLNTVIGKMSGLVSDPKQIREQRLSAVAKGLEKAFLVEEFNRILITNIRLKGFDRGIKVFEEKADLLPFEEAKLYGHNAAHALLGFLLLEKGCRFMSEGRDEPGIVRFVREAFVGESGRALCKKYAGLDPLFTETGFTAYADDLIARMLNPHLGDTVERITRDPRRKMGWNDRLVGTMRVVLGQGIEPVRYATGAAAALEVLQAEMKKPPAQILDEIWREDGAAGTAEARRIAELIETGRKETADERR